MDWLIQLEGNKIVRHVVLTEPRYSLGRGPENDLIFDFPHVSRVHAVLVKTGGVYEVLDQHSTNHVFVNHQQVTHAPLTSGDTIQFADQVKLLYLKEESLAALLNRLLNTLTTSDFLRLKEVTSQIISLDKLEHILHIVLTEVVSLVDAERGFIALTDANGAIQTQTTILHNLPLEHDNIHASIFSHSTVQQAIQTREPVFILRSGEEEPLDYSHSIIALNLRSVMCAPLVFGNTLVGVLYVDSGSQVEDFSERDRLFFTMLSNHAAIAIENAKMYSRLQESIQQLSLNEARLETLLQLHQMTQASVKEITAFTLEKALHLSQSQIGYIGFVHQNETALSIACWSESVLNRAESEQSLAAFLDQYTGMWGEAITQRTPIINNAPEALNPVQEGYPHAQITITRHLTIPVLEDNQVVAILCVGNKDQGYDTADIRQLTLLMQAMWRLIQRKRAEEAIRESEQKHRIVLESVPDPIAVYDLKGTVTYLNPAFIRIFGWSSETASQQMAGFVPPEKEDEAKLIVEKIIRGETVSGIETWRLTHTGALVEVSISGAGFFDNDGKLNGYVLTFQNISERKKAEQEMAYLAYHDVLTGLPNRKALYERLEQKLTQDSRIQGTRRISDERKKLALLFLDIARFKSINDTLGHETGDALLKLIAERLSGCLRQDDDIFRIAGDVFAVIINTPFNAIEVAKIAHKIQHAIALPCHIHGQELYVTMTIGICLYPDDGTTVEALVKHTDMALNAAKDEGGGYHFFTAAMNAKAQERMELESGLYAAIRHNQFLVYYQPLVNAVGQTIGMEALVRWQHPEKGMIAPSQFIPLAEESKAIVVIGEWVLHTACQQLKIWHDMGYQELYMSVNVSTRQFKEPDFVATVVRIIESTGVDPTHLKLEVTESSIMEKPEEAIAKMQLLCERGVHFSIDDFGTGYSSLSQLKHFPIDTLKIDRSFVVDAITNRDDQEIIKAILAMAHHMHIETVAEGVETSEQQDFLSREGCEMMQGYYFGKPLPVEAFEERLKMHTAHLKR